MVSKLDALIVAKELGDIPENVGFSVRGEIAKLFLSSNGISFENSNDSQALGGEELAKRLERVTVLIECVN